MARVGGERETKMSRTLDAMLVPKEVPFSAKVQSESVTVTSKTSGLEHPCFFYNLWREKSGKATQISSSQNSNRMI